MGLPMRIEVRRFLASAMFTPPNTISPFETCVCENIISKELQACYACNGELLFVVDKICRNPEVSCILWSPLLFNVVVVCLFFFLFEDTFFFRGEWRSMIYNNNLCWACYFCYSLCGVLIWNKKNIHVHPFYENNCGSRKFRK